MREKDIKGLKVPYSGAALAIGPEERLGTHLGFNFERVRQLGDIVVADLDPDLGGIEWWHAYKDLDNQTRVLISDYLVACARAIPQNLIEAKVFRLELDHAIDDYRKWLTRGVTAKGLRIPPPHGPYEDLSHYRVSAHLVGIFRAYGSALDCLAACIVGVGGVPTEVVKTNLGIAMGALNKIAIGCPRLAEFENALQGFEADSGPTGWLRWLVEMRNMLVHRGRRVLSWNIDADDGIVRDFVLHLSMSPELSDVEACVNADGYLAALLHVSHETFLDQLEESIHKYVTAVADELCLLWNERKNEPSMVGQPVKQWRQPKGVIRPPIFIGYPESQAVLRPVREIGASDEMHKRLIASKLTDRRSGDIGPSPAFWS